MRLAGLHWSALVQWHLKSLGRFIKEKAQIKTDAQ
jgi:hypothetical protein